MFTRGAYAGAGSRVQHAAADDLAAPLRAHRCLEVGEREHVRDVRADLARLVPTARTCARRGARSDGSLTVEITVGQPSTSRPFIMIRLVGSELALGAPRWPLPRATNGVAAQPTIRKRAPNRTQRRLSSEMSPPTPS